MPRKTRTSEKAKAAAAAAAVAAAKELRIVQAAAAAGKEAQIQAVVKELDPNARKQNYRGLAKELNISPSTLYRRLKKNQQNIVDGHKYINTALTKEEENRLKQYILDAEVWGISPNKRAVQSFAAEIRAKRENPPEEPMVSLRWVDRFLNRQNLYTGIAKPLEAVRFDAQ
ncbi:uncharacterized protein FA14DRAFT_94629 [Meira miltonrushii]|uniref:HTH CENPB-type domain-containing protein n=1 Tax=Meira miltonrushii TaxID=1280837 RepID=A0A316V2L3_9BASI|nr:uncharacterized protein FA14DRAFT_94629 [Meira miltonrushii]PWN31494.1 hypothetical protein FA14DRAFT_94629 [Meira miltonrushii]